MNTGKTEGSKKRVLGIIGSQRRLGNCELFVKELSRNIPEEHDLLLVRLPALDIRACNGCYRCLDGVCPVEDDMPFLLDQIASADAVVIAAPVYFFGAHASVKRLLDRAFCFFRVLEKTAGKPCVLANMYGMKDRIGTAPQTLLTLASFLCLEVKGSVNMEAALPGEVVKKAAHLRVARTLGTGLFGRKRKAGTGGCPFCGNEIVRMRRDRFICTLCHGSFHVNDEGETEKIRGGVTVGDVEGVRAHREWLKGMKKKFLAHKKELLQMALPYKDAGRWVVPEYQKKAGGYDGDRRI